MADWIKTPAYLLTLPDGDYEFFLWSSERQISKSSTLPKDASRFDLILSEHGDVLAAFDGESWHWVNAKSKAKLNVAGYDLVPDSRDKYDYVYWVEAAIPISRPDNQENRPRKRVRFDNSPPSTSNPIVNIRASYQRNRPLHGQDFALLNALNWLERKWDEGLICEIKPYPPEDKIGYPSFEAVQKTIQAGHLLEKETQESVWDVRNMSDVLPLTLSDFIDVFALEPQERTRCLSIPNCCPFEAPRTGSLSDFKFLVPQPIYNESVLTASHTAAGDWDVMINTKGWHTALHTDDRFVTHLHEHIFGEKLWILIKPPTVSELKSKTKDPFTPDVAYLHQLVAESLTPERGLFNFELMTALEHFEHCEISIAHLTEPGQSILVPPATMHAVLSLSDSAHRTLILYREEEFDASMDRCEFLLQQLGMVFKEAVDNPSGARFPEIR